MEKIKMYRNFLKSLWPIKDSLKTDQDIGKSQPEPQKPYPEGAKLINLPAYENINLGKVYLRDVIAKRRSRRKFTNKELSREELSYLLWATQGVKKGNPKLRTVPSAGGRHPFETYLFVNRVDDIKSGLYRYLPLEHKLLLIDEDLGLLDKISEACFEQRFIKESAVIFIWTAIPYRTEWRYSIVGHKMIAIDVGHLCQNLYLASESIDGGTCAIGRYHQDKLDKVLGVDGDNEFVIYAASVGKI